MATLATATVSTSQWLRSYDESFPRRNALSYTLIHRSLRTIHRGELTGKEIMGLGGHLQDPAGIFTAGQKRNIQVIALSFSTISVVASMITLYWFFMMKRNFRRHLILLLIIGDFGKSCWYLVFAAASLSGAKISTASNFCQANGFLLQAAVEACDAAILFMSIHMSLQIFSPTSKIFGRDGLHRFRHTVLGLYLSLPLLSASLAFIRSRQGYILQGPFCTLPIRPYWYRLALTWIPRYLIWAYITFVALRIYMHVGRGFKVFARQEGRISTCDPDLESEDTSGPQDLHVLKKHHELSSEAQSHQNDGASTNLFAEDQLTPMEWSGRRPSNHNLFAENQSTPMEGLGRRPSNHNLFADDQLTPMEGPGRRLSNFNWPPASAGSDGTEPAPGSQSRRGSRVTFQADGTDLLQVPVPTEHQPLGSISSVSSLKSSGDASSDGNRVHALEPIHENRTDNSNDAVDIMSADTPLKKRRRAIQRQLRLLFIYPVVYIIMWTIPFVYHSMNYSNYYAQHPVYALAVLAIFFQTALGSVDSVVFGWREKPWRQIPGSDGSFLGSFMFWRHHKQDSLARISTPSSFRGTANQEMASHGRAASGASRIGYMRSASHSSMKHKKTWSGSSDRITMEAERAAERLAMERAERGRSTPQGRSGSLSTNNNNNNKPPTEWWERRLSQAVLETPTAERDSFGFH